MQWIESEVNLNPFPEVNLTPFPEGFWRKVFGSGHGICAFDAFYENVEREDENGAKRNAVLEFRPAGGGPMLVACLWSKWSDVTGREPDLYSFAAITDARRPRWPRPATTGA